MNKPTETPRTEQVLIHDQPVKIEITKNAKGDFQYSYHIYAKTPQEAIDLIDHIETDLKCRYGPVPKPEAPAKGGA